jgi:uncharacterized membrane protein
MGMAEVEGTNMSTSSLLRKRGLEALRGQWQTALLITFAAGILSMALSVLQVHLSSVSGVLRSQISILSQWDARLSPYQGTFILLTILELLFGPVFGIGLNHYYLELHMGREAKFSLLFSRMQIFGKCLGQAIVMGLLASLWILVIYVPCILLFFLIRLISPFLIVVVALASMVSGILALYRYAMAPYLMAENPELGVMDTIRQSKEMMEGNKGRLFCLHLSFIGWILPAVGLALLLRSLLGTLGFAIGLFVAYAIQVYINSAVAAFYMELPTRMNRPEKPDQANAA